ncbi:dolichol kinase isoform X1 [Pieris brassicae]|uniref:dolichol kinase isoform X1 n=1 Tax=Pieris brassicae TaxID=7116 RepID=UPI001E661C66|nr:dolichol kinase isoform X1 [Pieris brassicae]
MFEHTLSILPEPVRIQYDTLIAPLNRNIKHNVQEGGIQTRPSQGNGLWCQFLLPSVLCMYFLLEEVTLLYKISTFLSLGLLSYCSLFILFLSLSSLVVKEPVYGGCLASSLMSTLLIYGVLNQNLLFSFLVSSATVLSFVWLLRYSLIKLPKTFTIGESMIANQSLTLFIVISLVNCMLKSPERDEDTFFIYAIVFTVFMAVGLMIVALYSLNDILQNMRSLIQIIATGATLVLITLHFIIGVDFVNKIVKFIFFTGYRKQILTFWLLLVGLSISALSIRTKLAIKATTVTRKTFHVLASLVFLSGILFDIQLMLLAAGIGLGAIIFVEALRKCKIEPVTSALQAAFLTYSDEKDCGTFAMTPLYLYVGLACPLLLVPSYSDDHKLELLSGVLSIGIGDTAASWFGSRFGFNKWSDSNRTLEGTAFNILSQIGTVYTLIIFELINPKNALARTTFVATVTSLVEAQTDQVDNLVLPLVSIAAFQITRFVL